MLKLFDINIQWNDAQFMKSMRKTNLMNIKDYVGELYERLV